MAFNSGYQQNDIEAVRGMSVSKIQKVCTDVPPNGRVVQEKTRDERPIYVVEDNDGAESDADEDGQFYSLMQMVDDDSDENDDDEGDGRFYSLVRLVDDSDTEDGGSYFLMRIIDENGENVEVDEVAVTYDGTATDELDDDVDVDVISISDDNCDNWPTASDGCGDRRTVALSEPIRVKRPLNAYLLWSLAERRKSRTSASATHSSSCPRDWARNGNE